MEYRKDIAQEMLMYQTKCTKDEMQSILVSTEFCYGLVPSCSRKTFVAVVIPSKREEIVQTEV